MPMQRHLYPDNWAEIASAVKESAGWTCQWCGKPCRRPGESVEDLALRLPTEWVGDLFDGEEEGERIQGKAHSQRFALTVAHLDHDPHNPNARLAALCIPCHCRYDLRQMGRKRQLKAERAGQLTLNLERHDQH